MSRSRCRALGDMPCSLLAALYAHAKGYHTRIRGHKYLTLIGGPNKYIK